MNKFELFDSDDESLVEQQEEFERYHCLKKTMDC